MKLTKVTVESAIADLCNNLSATYPGNQMLNYGEAVESIIENQAGNYVTKDGVTYCAVNDGYKLVLFLVRESASVEQQPAGGRANSLLRTVRIKLVANTTLESAEFALTSIINRTKGINYESTDYDSKAIARQYFGLEERNFETSFFSINLSITERINCEVAC
jgi:hypothetical protein